MALAGAGYLASEQGDLDRAQEACEEGLELLDTRQGRQARLSYGSSHAWGGWHGRGKSTSRQQQLFEESLALSREMNDTWWLATSLLDLALVPHSRGDYERATELYEESMDLFREQGDKRSLASA